MVREAFLEAVIFEQRLKCRERGGHVDTEGRVFQAKEMDYKALRTDQSQLHPWIQFMKVTE